LVRLLGYVGVCYAAAGVGGAVTVRSLGPWYSGLRKSRLNPPNWVFGPVWTTLYTMMGVAAWLVGRGGGDGERKRERPEKGPALAAWWIQLGLNMAWTAAFFGRRSPGGALGVIAALWAAIVASIGLSARVSTVAAWMLAPYLAWTTFAAYLNLRVFQLNRRAAD